MSESHRRAVDGNEAAASVAYRASEVIAIYPITPASTMGELADAWAAEGRKNLWGAVPAVSELQSEAGAVGAVHGALQTGALTTTFTASQGLLLMLPAMYKIAGELNAFCMHVAARTVATHALSIFGDHSDVMAARPTGFAMLASGSVQEAQDLAAVGHAAALESRVPFLHFFDGFRTSHEINELEVLGDEDLRALLSEARISEHRRRALTPDHPVLRGAAQNPDTFFQAREACQPFYDRCAGVVQDAFERFAARTGRRYRLFDYAGHPEAESVIVLMGSGAVCAARTARVLAERGRRVGVVTVRLYRPFDARALAEALPRTARRLAVLDRTKEPGAIGDPLFLDVVAALAEAEAEGLRAGLPRPLVTGGRYGLSSKEFTPAMVKAVFDELGREAPRRRFTVGIVDDVTRSSLEVDPDFDVEPEDETRALFYGLGSDGTVGANKNTIKIIVEDAGLHGQGYFVYDSKKSGAMTVSHLRFGPRPIEAPWLIDRAGFVACHQFHFLDRMDVLDRAAAGATFLLNSPYSAAEVWEHLPVEVQERILELGLELWVVDAYRVAQESGLGRRINAVMQTCFFALAEVLPRAEAIARIKEAVDSTYGKKGPELLRRNHAAIDAALDHLEKVEVPARASSAAHRRSPVPDDAPEFTRQVQGLMLSGRGDLLPVSAFPPDGTWPTGTSRFEKRGIALEVPTWNPEICIQCNKCAIVCPHAAIRAKVYEPAAAAGAPDGFLSVPFKGAEHAGQGYTIQVAPEDCTGCTVCVVVCPARDKENPRRKALELKPLPEVLERERASFGFFLDIPPADRAAVRHDPKGTQFLEPLFEFSGACAGCGETPYVKLLTQLFGDRALIANATGCSSIYGGNLPTTPYTKDAAGRGPAWSNSLFENNAEFGFGMSLATGQLAAEARRLLAEGNGALPGELVAAILGAAQDDEAGIAAQRERVAELRRRLAPGAADGHRRLLELADFLVKKSVWLVGGDGWAYDIGFGGLDHVLAQDRDVNVLVLDTEVYSNTGGQNSKATPLGASAKFAIAGKALPKKDLGLMMMTYGHVYVAQVALFAKDAQTVKAFLEAESYRGPSLIIAHSPCIAHGYDLAQGPEQQKNAVKAGVWPLYRFDPRRVAEGLPPLQLDSPPPSFPTRKYMEAEARFRIPEQLDRERFERLMAEAKRHAEARAAVYRQLAGLTIPRPDGEPVPAPGA